MNYYYQQNETQQGPTDIEGLRRAGITPDTLVWREGMANWQKARELPELAELFTSMPPMGSPASSYTPPPRNVVFCPHTYLVWAILTTILCCMPLGIVSIIYAARVEEVFQRGDYPLAKKYSNMARNWALASAITSLVFAILIYIFTYVSIGISSSLFDFI